MKQIGAYHRPSTFETALELAVTHGPAAEFLAGGQSLVNRMKQRSVDEGTIVIDVSRLPNLAFVEAEASVVRLGALTTHSDIVDSAVLAAIVPSLPEMVRQIADTQVRNLGTVGGSLAEAAPASDYPGFVTALGATVEVVSADGRRRVPTTDFFCGAHQTVLEPGEFMTELRIPIPDANTVVGFEKFPGWGGTPPLANATVVLSTVNGACSSACVIVGCVNDLPVRADRATRYLEGSRIADLDADRAGKYAAAEITPNPDRPVSERYLRDLVRATVTTAIENCLNQRP